VLDTPLNNWLAAPTIDMPLALCWANEPWTRRWDGLDQDVLIPQTYGEDWANRFWDDISPVLADPRYIRWDGAPVLVIYRLGQIPEAMKAIETWRKRAAEDGHPKLHVIAVAAPREEKPWSRELGESVDDVMAFPPGSGVDLHTLRHPNGRELIPGRPAAVLSYDAAFRPEIWRLGQLPCIFPGWDNTSRLGQSAYVFLGSNPLTCRRYLSVRRTSQDWPFLFVNAWNEWSEAGALEPGLRFSAGMLASISDASSDFSLRPLPRYRVRDRV
jgi:hypothetical protein